MTGLMIKQGGPAGKKALLAAVRPSTPSETHRVEVYDQIEQVHNVLEDALGRALSALPHIGGNVRDIAATITSVHEHWNNTKVAAIQTGKALVRLKRDCGDHYEKLFDESVTGHAVMPFGLSVECKLRKIGEAILDARVREDALPIAYSAAYELVTLSDYELQRAEEEGLLRPETQRAQVLTFKKDLRASKPAKVIDDPARLRAKREKLEKRRAALMGQIDEIDDQLEEIRETLNPTRPAQRPIAEEPKVFPEGPRGEAQVQNFTREIVKESGGTPQSEQAENFTREIEEGEGA